MLVAHEESGYGEWGASGAVRIDPGQLGRGLSLTVAPSWGAASRTGRLWSAPDATGLAPGGGFDPGRKLDAEIGYGFGLPGAPGVLTPFAGASLGNRRELRTGARWRIAPRATLSLEGTFRGGTGGAEPSERAVRLHGAMRF